MSIFYKEKEVKVPTFWGWLVLLVFIFGSFIFLLNRTYPFLAKHVPVNSKILVVEGWIPEYGLKNAMDFYYENGYEYMILTGVPITQWTYSSPFSNMAEASAGSLKRMYFKDSIYTVSIPNSVVRDRTYATALALKEAFKDWSISGDKFDLYSMGAHSRRSYLMFSKAFPDAEIGLIADTDLSFDGNRWYNTSRGFRIVFSELISYFYTRLFFFPHETTYLNQIIEGRYVDKIITDRYEKDRAYEDTLTSPLNKHDVEKFRGLPYFDVDKKYRVKAFFKLDTSQAAFNMPTSTTRAPLYRKYGVLSFMLRDSLFQLTAFQNLDYLKKHPDYKSLFIPFKDLSNGSDTYGGGRYLDIDIPANDSVYLDFNLVYNPYCAYDERWSCPIPPFENFLKTDINAGEKKYLK